ncbi:hypothetical protein B0H19DRAFT_523922 [Mycena capillaripes]|nr:hypothetical protein B0H19DRAFT_523922 [Mycena capillaripes]
MKIEEQDDEMTQSSSSKGTGNMAVFALIIGINDYLVPDDLPRLRGAVNDARAFKKYLLDPYDQQGLQVPPSNIFSLENNQATRDAILSAFKSHFINNKNIPSDGKATMILFFAGHGSRSEATGNRISTDRKVEVICPVDERTTNARGYVHAIPDYVLGWLLSELAKRKGRNITVILDSCSSAGMGRDVGRSRNAVTDSRPIPPELDSHLWLGETDSVSYRLWAPTTTSHVLLAACGVKEKAQELAFEGRIHGRFTVYLIHLLRSVPHSSTTYEQLIDMIPRWSGQTPYCGGKTNVLIFNGSSPITDRRAVLLKPYPNDLKGSSQLFSVDMGDVHGIVTGTEFYAYDPRDKFLCTLAARSVQINRTILAGEAELPVNIPPGSVARVSDWKNDPMILRVHTAGNFLHTADLFSAANERPPKFVQAKLEKAHIVLRSDNREIVIEQLTETMRKAITEVRFPLKSSPEYLPHIVDGIAHFHYLLDRANDGDPLRPLFALEMHRLRGQFPTREPDPNFGENGNLVVDGAVRFRSDEKAKYGLTIRNTSPEDLFPYLFYFDPEDYTIQKWYLPQHRDIVPPLPANTGTVTVGMGGEKALEFVLPTGQRKSSGFLKLFVTHDFVDLAWIEQITSPFDANFTGRLKIVREKLDRERTWDALTVTLTMTSN